MANGSNILTLTRELRDAWRLHSERRAMGGIHALRGFDYQFCVFLKALLLHWKSTPPERRTAGPGVFTEIVGDVLAVHTARPVHVTQVKLSLTAATLKNTLQEFLEISKAVSSITADVYFGISMPSVPDWDVQKRIIQWAKGQGFSELEAYSFARRIDILKESDPFDDCLAILANDLGDCRPVERLNELMGQLLHGSYSGDLKPLSLAIWGKLVEIENAKATGPTGVYFLTQADRSPRAVKEGGTLIGEQPKPFHLRTGYFAPRQPLYDNLTCAVTRWLQDEAYQRDPSLRVPMFWIGGRSGSGKSVALLHVLAAIHAQGAGHVMWLGDKPALLPTALAWAAALSQHGHQVIIGIDDPYAPHTRNDDQTLWANALSRLESMRNAGASDFLPAIVCCGPTEHAERFVQDFGSDVMLTRDDMSPYESPSDLAALRDWYRKRTNQEPPDLGDENVLLVQLFFQWRVRINLNQFSTRFKTRIEETGGEELREVISCMLCANRLYIGYPVAAVAARLSSEIPSALAKQDMLDRLLSEHHIARMSEGRTGFWLTHPHLANVIYENWHPETQTATRRAHLTRIIEDALRFGKNPQERTAPLWAISRTSDREAEEPTAGRLHASTLADVIPHVYGSRISCKEGIPIAELPAWMQIRAAFPQFNWDPDPVDLAINQVDSSNQHQTGLRLTCHKLLEHRSSMTNAQRDQACAAIHRLLDKCQDWFEWHNVAIDFYRRAPDSALDDLMTSWIRERLHKPPAQYLLLDLLSTKHVSPEIADLAAEVLVASSSNPRVMSNIAEALVQSMPTARSTEAVIQWAAEHCREWQAGFLLAQLVRKGCIQARQWAQEWAAAWHSERSANWVLEALCETGARDPMLLDYCLAWIESGHTEANPGYLLEKVIRTFAGESVVEQVAFDWLERTPASDGAWLFVYVALTDTTRDHRRLISLGMDALAVAWPAHRLWRQVWTELWHATHGNTKLLDTGVAALRRLPFHKLAWVESWNLFWHMASGPAVLAELGADWLDMCVIRRVWGSMWGRLWRLHPGDMRLKAIAIKWLGRNLRTWNVWFAIWQQVWLANKKDQTILSLASKWVSTVPISLPSWVVVWEILWHEDPGNPELKQKAIQWLTAADPNHPNWEKIWSFVWESDKANLDVRAMGQRWIEVAPRDHGSWSRVWRVLWSLDHTSSDLEGAGLKWVSDRQSFMHGDWQRVWKELIKHAPQNQLLWTLGRTWLREIPLRNNWWPNVWSALYSQYPGDRDLLRAACMWLEKTSPTRNQWCNIWKEVRHARAETAVLRTRVVEQVANNFDHQDWFVLWSSIGTDCVPSDELSDLARKWLQVTTVKKPNHGNWSVVWRALWEEGAQKPLLETIAMKWLERVPVIQTTWPPVWNLLREAQPANSVFMKAGRRLLRRMPNYHLGWYQVWRPQIDAAPTDEELLNMGREWLRTAPVQQANWSDAWCALHNLGQWPTELVDRAITWLELTASGQNLHGWQDVWSVLWDANYERDRLAEAARRWLQAVPNATSRTQIMSKLNEREKHPLQ